MNVEGLVDFAHEYERRLAAAYEERNRAVKRADDAAHIIGTERRNADALADVVRSLAPESAALKMHDDARNPPQYWQVAVPQGGSVKVFDAEGNEV